MPNEDAKQVAYHTLSIPQVVKQTHSHLENGLSAEEVARRYQLCGQNALPTDPGRPAWHRLLAQFHDPLLYILLVAGAVKAAGEPNHTADSQVR